MERGMVAVGDAIHRGPNARLPLDAVIQRGGPRDLQVLGAELEEIPCVLPAPQVGTGRSP